MSYPTRWGAMGSRLAVVAAGLAMLALSGCTEAGEVEDAPTPPSDAAINDAATTSEATDGAATTSEATDDAATTSEATDDAPTSEVAAPPSDLGDSVPLDTNMPDAPYPWLWSVPLLDGAEVLEWDQEGFNRFALPSGCELETYQGYLSMPEATDDESATLDIGQRLADDVASAEGAELIAEGLSGEVGYGLTGETRIALAGTTFAYPREGEAWQQTIYYRGMPGADSLASISVECPQELAELGDVELAEAMEQAGLIAGP